MADHTPKRQCDTDEWDSYYLARTPTDVEHFARSSTGLRALPTQQREAFLEERLGVWDPEKRAQLLASVPR